MFHLHHGNHLDSLAKQLSAVHSTCQSPPFFPEQIIVQNAGMARWLTLRISEHLGIAANLKFSFPAEYMWQLIRKVLDGLPEVEPFRPGVMRWRILQVLVHRADEFPELKSYLNDNNQLHVYQLACRLEDLLDRCLFYRPHWIGEWEKVRTPHWQARLWKKLIDDCDAVHWVGLQQQFLQAVDTGATGLKNQRVLIFGIAQLSPGYLQLLKSVASDMDIHVFLMNPCQQYWGDIVTEKAKLKSDDAVLDYLEIGNPLLASMGRQGRDFLDMLISLEPDEEYPCFEDNQGQSILAWIQNDILNLIDRSEASLNMSTKVSVDASISIHSCHTPMREIEVLYDQLLDLFNNDPDLKPEDIIVMMPSVQTYAPFVDAVFASAQHQIPYNVADRGLNQTNIVAEILTGLIDLADSRYDINRVLALLDYTPVSERFKLTEEDVAQIRHWCVQNNIRWGIDARMRESLDLPATQEHSWIAGIKRMLLGSMMSHDAMYDNILPYTEIEGRQSLILGRFVDFAEQLFEVREWNHLQLSLHEWMQRIRTLFSDLIQDDDYHAGLQEALISQLEQVVDQSEQADYADKISFQLLKHLLLSVVDMCSQQEQFVSGGVTFCELTPMRSVPFEVVCMIGMSDAAYPKSVSQQSFDLMLDDGYRRGDRSRRSEERYLFLESILAARYKLYISYVGRDVRKNTEIPPSVLVSELLDYIEQGFQIKRREVITEHPLQAFSKRYFDSESHLFTYADFPVNKQILHQEPVFLDADLDTTLDTELSLPELIRFIRFPVRYFLEQSLGIKQGQALEELPEREPFELDRFSNVELRHSIAQQFDQPNDDIINRLRAQGLLPHGTQGQRVFECEYEIVSSLIERSKDITTEPMPIQFQIESSVVFGVLENVSKQGVVVVSYGDLWCQDILEHWVNHLVLSMVSTDQVKHTVIIHPQGEYSFDPVEDPAKCLAILINAYQTGINTALHFMPKSAHEYAKVMKSPRSKKTPLDAARHVWAGSLHSLGEGQKQAYQLAFRGIDPLDENFEHWSKVIWLPILEHFQT